MTFAQKTGIGSRSPSFTPDRQKQVQSGRNEDSAPQHLKGRAAPQGGAAEAIAAPVGFILDLQAGAATGILSATGAAKAVA